MYLVATGLLQLCVHHPHCQDMYVWQGAITYFPPLLASFRYDLSNLTHYMLLLLLFHWTVHLNCWPMTA